jgi:uncharacterized protein
VKIVVYNMKRKGNIILVHTYSLGDLNLAFDQESGSLHIFDDISFNILQEYIVADGTRPNAVDISKIADRFMAENTNSSLNSNDLTFDSDKAFFEACDEIDRLINDGVLFASPIEMEIKDFYPDGPKIKALCLHLCHDCNLRCKYCFANTGDYHTGERGFLSLETGMKAVDFLIKASGPRRNLDIDFFGGEPLLNWDVVVALTKYCEEQGPLNNKNIRLTITTNAVLLDDEKTKFINEHMSNCVLSLDGRPQVNDEMRPKPSGKGSYDDVSDNIVKFIKSGNSSQYYVRGTYTRNNLDFADDVLHIASLGAKGISVEPVVGPPESGYSLRDEDLPVVFDEYEKLASKYLEYKGTDKHFDFFHFNIDLSNGPCSYKRLKGCGVGSEYIAVTPSGDIYPCHQFVGEKDFLMGNVNEIGDLYDSKFNSSDINTAKSDGFYGNRNSSTSNIKKSADLSVDKSLTSDINDNDSDTIIKNIDSFLDQKVKSKFKDLLVPQKLECSNCWAKYFCSGGCPANAYFSTGDVNGIYETGCKIQKKRLECALWIKAVQALDSNQ